MAELRVRTIGRRATEDLAARLAPLLLAGDLILLRGNLGGGKTTFVRGLVRGLGHPEPREVASPTFAIHHRYEGGRLPVNHLDLYRLEDEASMERQGVLDPLRDPTAVTCVEWAERLGALEPGAAWRIDFEHVSEEGRDLVFRLPLGRTAAVAQALA